MTIPDYDPTDPAEDVRPGRQVQAHIDANRPVPAGDYLVTEPLVIRSGRGLVGETPGGPGNPGVRLWAASGLTVPVVVTPSLVGEPDEWTHHAQIRDVQIRCAGQTSGHGMHLRRLGELTTVDRVQVIDAHGDGIHIEGDSTPLDLGHLAVHRSGRGGTGVGVRVSGSVSTHNQIRYLAADNNADAALWVTNLYRSSLHLGGFKSERWGATPGHERGIVLHNGNSGLLSIGGGRFHHGAGVTVPTALLSLLTDAGSPGRMILPSGVNWGDEVQATYLLESDSELVTSVAWVDASTYRGFPLTVRTSWKSIA